MQLAARVNTLIAWEMRYAGEECRAPGFLPMESADHDGTVYPADGPFRGRFPLIRPGERVSQTQVARTHHISKSTIGRWAIYSRETRPARHMLALFAAFSYLVEAAYQNYLELICNFTDCMISPKKSPRTHVRTSSLDRVERCSLESMSHNRSFSADFLGQSNRHTRFV